jgi:hypothetical protein
MKAGTVVLDADEVVAELLDQLDLPQQVGRRGRVRHREVPELERSASCSHNATPAGGLP